MIKLTTVIKVLAKMIHKITHFSSNYKLMFNFVSPTQEIINEFKI